MSIRLPNPITITTAQDTAIKTAANTVITNAAAIGPIDLDNAAKDLLNTIDDIRWPYALRTITIHAPNFPSVNPSFIPYGDARTNFDTMTRIREEKALLYKAIESLDEISQVAENNVFEFMIAMYDIAKKAQKAGTVPGIQSFIDDIAPLFAKTATSDNTVPPVI